MKKLVLSISLLSTIVTSGQNLNVAGNLLLTNAIDSKSIYTWLPSDQNWRIGMGIEPRFDKSLTTSHTQFISYAQGLGQGFALGANGGSSSFEIQGLNHQAFFRGNVGIGTTLADAKLSFGLSHNTGINQYVDPVFGVRNDILAVYESSPTHMYCFGMHSATMDIYVANGANLLFGHRSTSGNLTSSIFINGGDNIGLGTTSPTQRLDVVGNSKVSGKVGIGGITTFPTNLIYANYRLFVKGGILTDEVRVKLSTSSTWADYVFAEGYKLKSLKELEDFITKNNHLPNVPSGNQVKEEGINVADMARIQQEKIEELTLYIIQQNKRIEALETKINNL